MTVSLQEDPDHNRNMYLNYKYKNMKIKSYMHERANIHLNIIPIVTQIP